MGDLRDKLSANITFYRKKSGLTQKQLAEKVGLQHTSVSTWERGANSPDIEIIFQLADIFDIKVSDLFGVDTGNPTPYTHPETPAIAAAYDNASDKDRRVVRDVLDVPEGKPLRLVTPKDAEIADELAPEMQLFDLPPTAGTGNYLDDSSYTMTRFVNPPKRANIAVTVSGDSMEPKYSDGDIVFVETTSMLEDGEIGIFVVDGSSYIKQLRKNPLRLLSLNTARPNVDVDEYTTFYVVGRVLGKAELAE